MLRYVSICVSATHIETYAPCVFSVIGSGSFGRNGCTTTPTMFQFIVVFGCDVKVTAMSIITFGDRKRGIPRLLVSACAG
jgi:hypothetical protein